MTPHAACSDTAAALGSGRAATGVRIDAPHALPAESGQPGPIRIDPGHEPACDLPPAGPIPPAEPAATVQQIRTQAVQLAEHLAARQKELDRQESELGIRAAELDDALQKARGWWAEREAEVQRRRDHWLEERHKAEEQLQAARERIEQQRRRDWADLQEKRLAVEQRAERADRAWAALHQVHEEVSRLHRETLEMRLANEELRAQIDSSLPPEVRERTLQQIRAKLAEEYRRAGEHLERQKRELEAARRDLAEQHQKLRRERDRLQRLAARCAS